MKSCLPYFPPMMRVVDLDLEKGLCASTEKFNMGYENPFDDTETNL